MTEGPDNIVLQDSRRFDERQARFEDGMQDLKPRLRSIEGQVTALRADTTHVLHRIDRMGERVLRIGPKAGGPRYLYRFATEPSLSINTAAQGGNAALMALEEE